MVFSVTNIYVMYIHVLMTFLGKHVRNFLSYIRHHFLLSFPPRTAAPRWRPRRRKPSAPASPSSTSLGLSRETKSFRESHANSDEVGQMTSLNFVVFFMSFFTCCFSVVFSSVFGCEVHDQVRLEGLVKNKGLAVFCENTWSNGQLIQYETYLCNYPIMCYPCYPCFLNANAGHTSGTNGASRS